MKITASLNEKIVKAVRISMHAATSPPDFHRRTAISRPLRRKLLQIVTPKNLRAVYDWAGAYRTVDMRKATLSRGK